MDMLTSVCRANPDLIALFKSRGGRWALLLRHTVVPLSEERDEWFAETRKVARSVIASLRAAGVKGRFTVLQWRPFGEVAFVLRSWSCRYDGDPARRGELTRVVLGRLADRKFVSSQLARS